ncbi:MAG: DNA polymerase domain-containing protein [Thermoplasmata archaeon]
MRGWLIDVYPDYQDNFMVLWFKTKCGVKKIVDRGFNPRFYVHHPSHEELRALAKDLEILDSVAETEMVEKKIDIRSRTPEKVLEVTPRNYSDLRNCARIIDSRGGYYDYKLFNVDLRLSQRYLAERGLFPMAMVDISNGLKLEDGQFRLKYAMPNLKSVNLRICTGTRIPTYHDTLSRIEVDDTVLEGSEEEMLLGLVEVLRVKDPDVIYTKKGDGFVLPYLYCRAAANGIKDGFVLGREPQQMSKKRRGKSYFSYGNILYKPPSYTLRGRLHIDRTSSFIFGEGGLSGLIDLSRLSCIPVQDLSRLSPGSAISAMQVNFAIKDGYLILWKKNIPEEFKTAEELIVADRGGLIFEPVVGIHDGVVEVDFTSLYPNIMAKYNLSPETVLCDCCPDSKRRVPELLYNVCEKRIGLIPKVVKPLVQRRIAFKKLAKSQPERREIYRQRADVLKWILVTAFGYTGYRNARFGRIECHESINAYGRDILVRTMEIAEQYGYEVLHGIVDCLWLKPDGYEDHEDFCDYVSRYIEIPLELEGVYKWLVFLPNKTTGIGALNRYYGLFENNELKVRGIDLRKRDTPELVKKAQLEMLKVLAKADNSTEFMERIPECIGVLRRYHDMIENGNCDLGDLIITKRISKTLEDYSQFNDQVAALKQFKRHGFEVHPGEKVRYIICDSSTRECMKRVKIAEFIDGDERYDAQKYIELLLRAGEGMLSPFGYDEERLRERMRG